MSRLAPGGDVLIKYFMKKSIKIFLLVIIIIILLFCFWLAYKLFNYNGDQNLINHLFLEDPSQELAAVVDVIDPSLMTLEERLQFGLSPLVKAEVWQRSPSGTILVYKKISEDDYQARLEQIEKNKKYDKNNRGEQVEILNDEDKHKLGLFHLGVYELVARNENGGVAAYRYLRIGNEKKIALEWLSEDEKNELGVDPGARIQLLKRGESGKILAYKIIKDDADILETY